MIGWCRQGGRGPSAVHCLADAEYGAAQVDSSVAGCTDVLLKGVLAPIIDQRWPPLLRVCPQEEIYKQRLAALKREEDMLRGELTRLEAEKVAHIRHAHIQIVLIVPSMACWPGCWCCLAQHPELGPFAA